MSSFWGRVSTPTCGKAGWTALSGKRSREAECAGGASGSQSPVINPCPPLQTPLSLAHVRILEFSPLQSASGCWRDREPGRGSSVSHLSVGGHLAHLAPDRCPHHLPGGSAAGSQWSTYQCVAHLASQGLPFQQVLQAECLTELCWGCSLPTEA